MKPTFRFTAVLALLALLTAAHPVQTGGADPATFLADVKTELTKQWPKNRSILLLFHGHSVPSGYFKTPYVNTLAAYPYQLLQRVKECYPYAVVSVLTTSIGGENSVQGAARFQTDVLPHKPDVLFIDYASTTAASGWKRRSGLANHD